MAISFRTVDPALLEHIKELLLEGHSYIEVARAVGLMRKEVTDLNCMKLHIDYHAAFAERVARHGVPSRLHVTDQFGAWFSGLFDGEGTFVLRMDHRKFAGYKPWYEVSVGARIQLRNDDRPVLQYVVDNLGGTVMARKRRSGNPQTLWFIERIADTAEILMPVFDTYPLHSKKAREYEHWRQAVLLLYVKTRGGVRGMQKKAHWRADDYTGLAAHAAAIKAIRVYKRPSP